MTELRSQRSAIGKIVSLSPLLFALGIFSALLFALSLHAQAQQPKKAARIGLLMSSTPASTASVLKVFRQSLRELGYVEGQSITIEDRYAEGKLDRLPKLVAELIQPNVEVIVVSGEA